MLFAVCRSPFAVGTRTSPRTARSFRCANPLDKTRKHLFDVRRCTLQHLSLPWSEKFQFTRQQNKTNQFVGRTGSYVQELPEFGTGRSSASLRDIGGDGSRRSSHLAGQPKFFGIWIHSRRAIDTQRQSLTALPYFQFPEVLYMLTPFRVIPEGATLPQEYFTNQVLGDLVYLSRLTVQLFDSPFRVALTANGALQTANISGELPC